MGDLGYALPTLPTKKKLCKAHILPEWCYRRLYPTGKIEGESLIAISPGLNYTQKMRKGSYDNTILCADCDNTFSEYENYAKKVMDSQNWQIKYSTHEVPLLVYKSGNLDENKLKLFALSVLYKMALSKRPEYEGISFNSRRLSQLRKSLKNGTAGNTEFFMTLFHKYLPHEKGIDDKIALIPYTSEIEGNEFANISFGNGFVAVTNISSTDEPKVFRKVALGTGNQCVLHFQKIEEYPYFSDLLKTSKNIKH